MGGKKEDLKRIFIRQNNLSDVDNEKSQTDCSSDSLDNVQRQKVEAYLHTIVSDEFPLRKSELRFIKAFIKDESKKYEVRRLQQEAKVSGDYDDNDESEREQEYEEEDFGELEEFDEVEGERERLNGVEEDYIKSQRSETFDSSYTNNSCSVCSYQKHNQTRVSADSEVPIENLNPTSLGSKTDNSTKGGTSDRSVQFAAKTSDSSLESARSMFGPIAFTAKDVMNLVKRDCYALMKQEARSKRAGVSKEEGSDVNACEADNLNSYLPSFRSLALSCDSSQKRVESHNIVDCRTEERRRKEATTNDLASKEVGNAGLREANESRNYLASYPSKGPACEVLQKRIDGPQIVDCRNEEGRRKEPNRNDYLLKGEESVGPRGSIDSVNYLPSYQSVAPPCDGLQKRSESPKIIGGGSEEDCRKVKKILLTDGLFMDANETDDDDPQDILEKKLHTNRRAAQENDRSRSSRSRRNKKSSNDSKSRSSSKMVLNTMKSSVNTVDLSTGDKDDKPTDEEYSWRFIIHANEDCTYTDSFLDALYLSRNDSDRRSIQVGDHKQNVEFDCSSRNKIPQICEVTNDDCGVETISSIERKYVVEEFSGEEQVYNGPDGDSKNQQHDAMKDAYNEVVEEIFSVEKPSLDSKVCTENNLSAGGSGPNRMLHENKVYNIVRNMIMKSADDDESHGDNIYVTRGAELTEPDDMLHMSSIEAQQDLIGSHRSIGYSISSEALPFEGTSDIFSARQDIIRPEIYTQDNEAQENALESQYYSPHQGGSYCRKHYAALEKLIRDWPNENHEIKDLGKRNRFHDYPEFELDIESVSSYDSEKSRNFPAQSTTYSKKSPMVLSRTLHMPHLRHVSSKKSFVISKGPPKKSAIIISPSGSAKYFCPSKSSDRLLNNEISLGETSRVKIHRQNLSNRYFPSTISQLGFQFTERSSTMSVTREASNRTYNARDQLCSQFIMKDSEVLVGDSVCTSQPDTHQHLMKTETSRSFKVTQQCVSCQVHLPNCECKADSDSPLYKGLCISQVCTDDGDKSFSETQSLNYDDSILSETESGRYKVPKSVYSKIRHVQPLIDDIQKICLKNIRRNTELIESVNQIPKIFTKDASH